MSQDTTLLLGLEGLAVHRVENDSEGCLVVHMVTADAEAARCPGCGGLSTSPKEWVITHPRDALYGGRVVELSWRKRG